MIGALLVVTLLLPPAPGKAAGPEHHAPPPVSAEQLGGLPEARYDAVIPGLDAPAPKRFGDGPRTVLTLSADVPLYGAARDRPVARLAARNFLGRPTVVLGYLARRDGWQLILTPSRRQLPSAGPGATAQSYAWVRVEDVPQPDVAAAIVEISVSREMLTIRGDHATRIFPAGVGGDGTPTPTDVTGYLQERYLDPAQGQADYPIQLTSLHATAADEPYGGTDGGLIGIHLGSGRSHGCIRIPAEAVAAVNALPLGTPVRIVP